VKLTDFGLWFEYCSGNKYEWSVTIPKNPIYDICYDGYYLGKQWSDFDLVIWKDTPHTIKLKNKFTNVGMYYEIGRLLTLDDFEIVQNPDYKGTE
jgi:hypothetical protein